VSASWRTDDGPRDDGRAAVPVLAPMTPSRLDEVLAVEVAAYAFPWTRNNFADSLAAGYPARVLVDEATGALLGYFVAMAGVDEMHLLNITVAPPVQGRGHARRLLAELLRLCGEHDARELWLEVRVSNAHARAIYEHLGFVQVGMRKGYYPAGFGRREDAVVMTLDLARPRSQREGGGDALD
jgi:ribosomal-protein-alanine N-acetyltransferase